MNTGLALDVTPTSALRSVLIWGVSMLALVGLSGRRLRQQLAGLLFQTAFPVLLAVVFVAIPWGASKEFPQWWERWWTYALPVATLLLAVVFWLPQQGARLSWFGWWDFRYPLTTPHSETAREEAGEALSVTPGAPGERPLAVPRQTGLRLLAYLLLLVGLAGTCVPTMVLSHRDSYPQWLVSNGFLLGVTGLFVMGYARKVLVLARTRRERDFPSLPVSEKTWVGALLWSAAWLCCLAGVTMTLGAMSVMMGSADHLWWATYIAFPLMIVGGAVFTQGRKTFLRARRHRARIIPSPRILGAGSYTLYLRPFDDDRRRTAIHDIPLPGAVGGLSLVLSGRSAEEQIADVLRPVGPLIAVGAPGERLPHAGAVRMYLPKTPKEAWQEPVRQLMRRSRLTVLTLGTSEGTMWELAEALRLLPPQRLVLFLPSMDGDDYERIRAEIGSRLPPGPPWLAHSHREPVQGVIHFDADWTPTLTPVMSTRHNQRWNLFVALLPGMKAALTSLSEHEGRTGRHCG
jgi:hypothetical protein